MPAQFNVGSESMSAVSSSSIGQCDRPASCDDVLHDRHQPYQGPTHHTQTLHQQQPGRCRVASKHCKTARMNHLSSDDNNRTSLNCSALVAIQCQRMHGYTIRPWRMWFMRSLCSTAGFDISTLYTSLTRQIIQQPVQVNIIFQDWLWSFTLYSNIVLETIRMFELIHRFAYPLSKSDKILQLSIPYVDLFSCTGTR